jgi:hypothetical protein
MLPNSELAYAHEVFFTSVTTVEFHDVRVVFRARSQAIPSFDQGESVSCPMQLFLIRLWVTIPKSVFCDPLPDQSLEYRAQDIA